MKKNVKKHPLLRTVLALLVLAVLTDCNTKKDVIKDEIFLDIPIGDITKNISFYTAIINDIEIEVMAVLTSDGGILTVFNRCERCHKSGKGFVQENDEIICRQCNMRFNIDKIDFEPNRCSPVPVPDEKKNKTEKLIKIPHEVLSTYSYLFTTWETEQIEKEDAAE